MTEQQKEIATIKERNIKVELSDADCDRVSKLCGKHNITVSELIKNFIGDLVDGTYTNGSDERDFARRWFNRCWFGYDLDEDESLLGYFLSKYYHPEDFLDVLDNIQTAKEQIETDKEDLEYWQGELEYLQQEYHRFIDGFAENHPEADIDREIEKVRKWYDEKELMKNG